MKRGGRESPLVRERDRANGAGFAATGPPGKRAGKNYPKT